MKTCSVFSSKTPSIVKITWPPFRCLLIIRIIRNLPYTTTQTTPLSPIFYISEFFQNLQAHQEKSDDLFIVTPHGIIDGRIAHSLNNILLLRQADKYLGTASLASVREKACIV